MLAAMRSRVTPLLVLALVALATTAAACGDGSHPAVVASSLTPAVTGTPTPGATTNGPSGTVTSPGAASSSAAPNAGATATTTSPTPSGGATPAQVTDAGIRADIVKRLGESPSLVGLDVGVRVKHRVVYLFGTVKSKAEKVTAEHIAVTEPGIVKVVSLIQIVPGGGGY